MEKREIFPITTLCLLQPPLSNSIRCFHFVGRLLLRPNTNRFYQILNILSLSLSLSLDKDVIR